MATFAGKVAVRDSFDEEEVSDDVDDEVFIRDGRNGFKLDEERGVKRPLMPPRRRLKTAKVPSNSYPHSKLRCRAFLAPCCYGIMALGALLGLIALAVILFNFLPVTLDQIRFWKGNFQNASRKVIIPCSDFTITDVWTKSFPKLTSETAVRLSDLNNDKVLDVIVGYGTGADGRYVPDFVCSLYFRRDPPCLGGIVALDGRNGDILWQHWTQRPVFSVDCAADLTEDKVHDCLIGGKGGLLHAVNGHDGSLLWHLEDSLQQQQLEPLLNIYSAQYISDIDGDNFVDVVAAHTATDPAGTTVKGHLLLISGKTGRLLRMLDMPGASESYYAPQLLVHPDGQKKVLIGTGGTLFNSQGGIHTIPLSVLATSNKFSTSSIVISDSQGSLAPPVLADITNDGVEDIIASFFNSTVIAFDGRTFLPLWNYSFPNSQSLSPPTPGYFNSDDVPDFLVKYETGPGFPLYYYSQTNILDGKTGLPLLDNHIVDSVGSQMGGLSVSMEGFGNDWFLYWTANCVGFEGSQTPFSFAKGSTLRAQSQADLCHLRFNSSMTATLQAINQHVKPPGLGLYSTAWREILEHNRSQNARNEANQYLASHPDFWSIFDTQLKIDTYASLLPKSGDISQEGPSSWSKNSPDLAMDQLGQSFGGSTLNGRVSSIGSSSRDGGVAPAATERRTGESDKLGEPQYSRVQNHHVAKNRRPSSWAQEQKSWNLEVGPERFSDNTRLKQIFNPQGSDGFSHDYDTRSSDIGDDPRSRGDYSGLLADLRNSNSEARETASNFLQAIHDEALQEDKQLKRSYPNDDSKNSYSNPGREVRQAKSLNAKNENEGKREETYNETDREVPRSIYPITSTGTLAPPVSGSGVDLVIVSYWIPPSEGVQILFPNDIQCIRDGITRASRDGSGKFSGMDEETLEVAVTAECLIYRLSRSTSSGSSSYAEYHLEPHPGFITQSFPETVAESSAFYNMDVRLGQLTVYRLNLQCRCKKIQPQTESCAKILPFEKQSWPSFMGSDGRGYFHPRF